MKLMVIVRDTGCKFFVNFNEILDQGSIDEKADYCVRCLSIS
jgi:hypothetical protein